MVNGRIGVHSGAGEKMKALMVVLCCFVLVASAFQQIGTEINDGVDSYYTVIDEPGHNCGDDIQVTCGRQLTCLDGGIVKCDGAPPGKCSYKAGSCFNGKHTILGYVKCDEWKETCNECTRCCIGT